MSNWPVLPYGPQDGSRDARLRGLRRDVEDLRRRPQPADSPYDIKVFKDNEVVVEITDEDAFHFPVDDDLDGLVLEWAEAFVSTAGTGDTVVELFNVTQAGAAMLTTPITIPSGVEASFSLGVPSSVPDPSIVLASADHLRIDVTSAGAGAKGLAVLLRFNIIPLTAP